jgi:protein-disulfide isomerase
MSKKGRQASERIRAMQAQQAATERRRRAVIVGAIVVAVIAVVVGIGIVVQSNRSDTASGTGPPAGVTSHNGVYRGQASAPVSVVVSEDFQCPVCKAFEENVGSTLQSDIAKGTIRLEYRPIAFLDRQSTTNYSSRALETAACALDQGGPSVFNALHDLLFANQPKEGSAGLSDDELAGLAAQAGADKSAVAACQKDGTYEGWAHDATEQASKDGINGTPTYFVDGQQVSFSNSEEPKVTLTKLIDAAESAQ